MLDSSLAGLRQLEHLLLSLNRRALWGKHTHLTKFAFLCELESLIVACCGAYLARSKVRARAVRTTLRDDHRVVMGAGVDAAHNVTGFLNRRHVARVGRVATAERGHCRQSAWLSRQAGDVYLEVRIARARSPNRVVVNLHFGRVLVHAECFLNLRRR